MPDFFFVVVEQDMATNEGRVATDVGWIAESIFITLLELLDEVRSQRLWGGMIPATHRPDYTWAWWALKREEISKCIREHTASWMWRL
ncbi:hypothetical protein A9513_000390 [Pseudomonas sp. AU12215]|nr:hypothetical protein A9513_000390 [Pseudomonas sp. AU12215]